MPHRSTPKSLFRLILLSFCAVLVIPAFSHAAPLPRRIMLGTQIQNASDETRNRLGIAAAGGVEVLMVVPDSNAAAAKIRKGDVILAVGGKEFVNVAGFLELVGTLRGGTDVEIRLNREGKERTLTATLNSLPLETSEEFDVENSFVDSPAGRLRTVLTLPRNATRSRAILLLSGLGNATVEHPVSDPIGFRAIATALTRQGFAVLRVDKPGCGDSEGGPARDASFDAIIEGYAAGVRLLKSDKRIDATQIYLFGVSIGGLQAPLVAQKEPVAGIALFGTAGTNWPEYLQENSRRQLALSGIGPGQIEQEVSQISAGWKALVDEKLTPDEIADRHPELGEWVEQNWAEGRYFSGITYKFFWELCRADILAAWKEFNGPVLALWGESDFVTSAADHEKLAASANQKQTGRGTFRKIPGVDHNLQAAPTIEDAIRNTQQPGVSAALSVTNEVIEWLNGIP